jgi:hypothetical protein
VAREHASSPQVSRKTSGEQQADAAQTLMFGLSTQALKEAEAVKEL